MFKKFIIFPIILVWIIQSSFPAMVFAQTASVAGPSMQLPFIQGMTLHADDPLRLDFHVDRGDATLSDEHYHDESMRMFRYFLAALSIPEDQLWVNLSPVEPDRIAVAALQKTELGVAMLEQDLQLKEFVSEVLSPEHEAGKKFWENIYDVGAGSQPAQDQGRVMNPPLQETIESFNKVWIVPDYVKLHVKDGSVFVAESRLKVLTEEDHALFARRDDRHANQGESPMSDVKDILRSVILPVIEKEVNEGVRFEELRRIFRAVVLASWYKRSLLNSPLRQGYVDASSVKGIALTDSSVVQQTYQQYLDVFRAAQEGVLHEDYDPSSQQVVARKYLTGGVIGRAESVILGDFASLVKQNIIGRTIDTFSVNLADSAMMIEEEDMNVPLTKRDLEKLRPPGLFPSAADFFHQLKKWRMEHPGWNLVILSRHPESASNLFEYVQTPTTFSPITRRGWQQVEALANFFSKTGIRFDSYFSSDQERVYSMVDFIVSRLDPSLDQYIIPLKRLREAGLLDGMPHGLPNDFARKILPVNVLRLMRNNPYIFMNEHYSIGQVQSSLQQLKDILAGSRGQNILIGTHGVTMMMVLMTFLNIDYHKFKAVEEVLTQGGIPYVGLTGIAVNPNTGHWEMVFMPDNSYLPEILQQRRLASQISRSKLAKEENFFRSVMEGRARNTTNPYKLSDWLVNPGFGVIDKEEALNQAWKLLERIGYQEQFDQVDMEAVIGYSKTSLFDKAMMNPGGVDFNMSRMTWSGTPEDYSGFYGHYTDEILGDLVPVIRGVQAFDETVVR